MKELTTTFNSLLQDKRVRAEQSKYEAIQRQRSSAINKYKRAYQEFLDLEAGLQSAKNWYSEMRETVESLEKNVETFVNNRRSEGAQLLNQIEQDRSVNKNAQAEMERERLRGLMERMSMEPPKSTPPLPSSRPTPTPLFQQGQGPRYGQTSTFPGQYQVPTSPPPNQQTYPGYTSPPPPSTFTYNPSQFGRTPGPTSPPPNQTSFGMNAMRGPASPPPTQTSFGQQHQTSHQAYGSYGGAQTPQHGSGGYVPPGFVPPPPPPGPPPLGPQQTIHYEYAPLNGHAQNPQPRSSQQQQPSDPWAGLNSWK